MELAAKAHLFQGFDGPFPPFGLSYAGDGQGQLHVGKNRLMRNQVVALKYEADGVVPVGVPVTVLVFFCGNTVDNQVAGIVAVQSADDI